MTTAIVFVACVAIAVTVGLWIGRDPEGAKTLGDQILQLFKRKQK